MNKKVFSLWMLSQLTAAVAIESANLRGKTRSLKENNNEEFHRNLEISAAERFAYWTPEKVKRATPLDLKLDALSGEAYQSGLGGNLVSYGQSADGINDELNVLYRDSVVPLGDLMKGVASTASQFVEGHTRRRELLIIQKERMDTSNAVSLMDDGARVADVVSETDIILKRQQQDKPQPKKSGNEADKRKTNQAQKQWKRKTPKLRQLRPSRGSTVKDQTTFRAKVLPADRAIEAVYLQLTDFDGEASDFISLRAVSSKPDEKMYEVSLGGFEEYAGTQWLYKVIVVSGGVQYTYVDIPFTVAGSKVVQSSPPTATPQPMSSVPIDRGTVLEAEWPHGGAIQSSTGRILFDFGGETHVCSGTVINDGGIYNERSLVMTAAHCAYDDITKRFATNAIFIPDQSRSLESTDFDCTNDPYGCWYLSFAVVEKGWASNSFPANAEFDYAFWVVHDYVGTHIDGYNNEFASGFLDQDVEPMNIDFGTNPRELFFSSFGYSEEYDPGFRYCAGDAKTINEVPGYTNLFLPQCNLMGGASGGPWLADIDSSGIGTVMSLNSWGFVDEPGMAGPSLQTSSGSKAECLFNVARTYQDPGSTRGYVITC